jgi:Ser/Thr protein kinase RdoA (MazF antagonist)
MKAYVELTHRGRMRRMGRLAREALEAYGFGGARLRLIVDAGNVMYRVTTEGRPVDEAGSDLYVEGRFLLRLHHPGYQSVGAVDSELMWLSALCEAGLPVPMPLRTANGGLSVEVSVPGVPRVRRCSLLRWVRGRMVDGRARRDHVVSMGRLLGRLHEHSAGWRLPEGFVRRHYDVNGLWEDDTGTGYAAREVWPRIPGRFLRAFEEVTGRVGRVMEEWGRGPEVFGLIHADLGLDANALIHGGECRAIDFDDCGFGFWVYDLAIALAQWEGEGVWPSYRDALLEGYSGVRELPGEQLDRLELFLAAIRAMEVFWGTAGVMRRPGSAYWVERRERALEHMRSYLRRNPSDQ